MTALAAACAKASETGGATTYSVTFTMPGSYTYDCAVRGARVVRPSVVSIPS